LDSVRVRRRRGLAAAGPPPAGRPGAGVPRAIPCRRLQEGGPDRARENWTRATSSSNHLYLRASESADLIESASRSLRVPTGPVRRRPARLRQQESGSGEPEFGSQLDAFGTEQAGLGPRLKPAARGRPGLWHDRVSWSARGPGWYLKYFLHQPLNTPGMCEGKSNLIVTATGLEQ
jgi:hypothetical protein